MKNLIDSFYKKDKPQLSYAEFIQAMRRYPRVLCDTTAEQALKELKNGECAVVPSTWYYLPTNIR